MPIGPVQRYPQGLLDVLSVKGLSPPSLMSDAIVGVVDLLQFYGLTQAQRRQATDAALAEGSLLTITVPATEHWLLYTVEFAYAKTAVVTDVNVSLAYGPAGQTVSFREHVRIPNGASANTGTIVVGHQMAYPVILRPGWQVTGRLDLLGAEPSLTTALSVLVGVLG